MAHQNPTSLTMRMNVRAIMQSHWIALGFLVPAVVMLIIHHRLGLSDALNVPTPPGEREAHLFNWVTVAVFWFGVGGYLLHALSLFNRGWRWFAAKLVILAGYWITILLVA